MLSGAMLVHVSHDLAQTFRKLNISPVVWHFLKIEELEEQCNEINKEKERNAQLSRRLQELETELQDKELVSAMIIERAYISEFELVCLLLTMDVDLWTDPPTARKSPKSGVLPVSRFSGRTLQQ